MKKYKDTILSLSLRGFLFLFKFLLNQFLRKKIKYSFFVPSNLF